MPEENSTPLDTGIYREQIRTITLPGDAITPRALKVLARLHKRRISADRMLRDVERRAKEYLGKFAVEFTRWKDAEGQQHSAVWELPPDAPPAAYDVKEMLWAVHAVRDAMTRGATSAAIAAAYRLGRHEERAAVRAFEPAVVAHRKGAADRRKGAAAANARHTGKHAEIREMWTRLRRDGCSKSKADAKIAAELGLSIDTVRRATRPIRENKS